MTCPTWLRVIRSRFQIRQEIEFERSAPNLLQENPNVTGKPPNETDLDTVWCISRCGLSISQPSLLWNLKTIYEGLLSWAEFRSQIDIVTALWYISGQCCLNLSQQFHDQWLPNKNWGEFCKIGWETQKGWDDQRWTVLCFDVWPLSSCNNVALRFLHSVFDNTAKSMIRSESDQAFGTTKTLR